MNEVSFNRDDLSIQNPCKDCTTLCGQASLVEGYLQTYGDFPGDLRICPVEYQAGQY